MLDGYGLLTDGWIRHSIGFSSQPVEFTQEATVSKNERRTPRTPATKFANLRKKMQKQKPKAKTLRKGKK